MKAKELIEILSQAPEAEVGYEHLIITNAWVDSDQYIELDGQSAKSEYQNRTSGVFAVITEYDGAIPEINGIYTTFEKAKKTKDWLLKYSTKEENGYADIKNVFIRNMFLV